MLVCNDADFNDMITHCFSTGTCSFRRKDAGVNQRRAEGGCYLSEAAAFLRVLGLGHAAVLWAAALLWQGQIPLLPPSWTPLLAWPALVSPSALRTHL